MGEVKKRAGVMSVMRESSGGKSARCGGRFVTAAALCLVLGACGSGVTTPAQNALGSILSAGAPEPVEIDPQLIARERTCPPVNVQPETESLRREAGSSEASQLSWQASITETARECRPSDGGTKVRVGIAGRLIEGPAGSSGTVELPVRVAVRERGEITYSRLHKIRVERQGASQPWAFVDEEVVVDDVRQAQIVVGFDNS